MGRNLGELHYVEQLHGDSLKNPFTQGASRRYKDKDSAVQGEAEGERIYIRKFTHTSYDVSLYLESMF